MNNNANPHIKWSENVIIADADYVDHVAFDLIVNFERMIGRRIPPADTARWIDCIALDGGLREGEHQCQAIFIHKKSSTDMSNFHPGNFDEDLNAKAFKDRLGEFVLTSLPVEEEFVSFNEFFIDILQTAANSGDTRRIMVIPNAEDAELYAKIQHTLRHVDEDKHITVFSMQPLPGGNFKQEILGYSLMNALGIRADELEG